MVWLSECHEFVYQFDPGDAWLHICRVAEGRIDPLEEIGEAPAEPTAYDGWAARWRERLSQEPQHSATRQAAMRAANPAYIPRNHQIEAMITAAVDQDDFTRMDELLAVLSRPYEDQSEFIRYAQPPQPHEQVKATFCGT